MGYQVLARKYRPQRFADVAGQDHVTRTLLNALAQNRIAHGYIFSGHRGIGKTTIARILAMALNCRTAVGSTERPTHEPCLQCFSCIEISSGGNPGENGPMQSMNFIEIDAASNRGIDDVRTIRKDALIEPLGDKYKIILLDEAHQITDAAFNAILKTLEEPPEWTIFMMATTEPENIPQTIRSRCQHFSFHAVKFDDILAQLRMIAAHEQVEGEDAALALLAEAGDGSMRDALSIMDQAIASAPCNDAGKPVLAAQQIRDLMGSVPNAVFERLMEAVAAGQPADLMEQLNVLLNAGHSPLSLARQLVRYLRNALMAKLGGEQTELLQISADERARAARTALLFSEEDLTRNLQIVLRTFDDLNYRQEQRFHLELGLLKLVHAQRLLPLEEFLSGIATGAARGPAAPASRPTPSSAARPMSSTPSPRQTPAPAPKEEGAPLSPFAPIPGFGITPSPKQSASSPVAEMERSSPAAAVASAPAPVAQSAFIPPAAAPAATSPFTAAAVPATNAFAATLTEGALAKAPEFAADPQPTATEEPAPAIKPPQAAASGDVSSDALRDGVVVALAGAGHQSTSQLLAGANWILDAGMLRIEVPGMGKKMLALAVNAAAEKIMRLELQRLGGPARFMVVPGEGAAASGPAVAPLAGSIEEEALKNPLVQKAKEIFHAEVRSVVDLRVK
jgi:DNA polymerase-3 subunit gamma/tau